jgi:hypothetical protein
VKVAGGHAHSLALSAQVNESNIFAFILNSGFVNETAIYREMSMCLAAMLLVN